MSMSDTRSDTRSTEGRVSTMRSNALLADSRVPTTPPSLALPDALTLPKIPLLKTSMIEEGFQELLIILPVWIQEAALSVKGLEEIAVDVGRDLVVKYDGGYEVFDRRVTKEDLHYIVHRIHGFREDNRTGIDKTFHRIAAIRDRYGEIVGITIRFGRFIAGAAQVLYSMLTNSKDSLMLIGRPGVGKTTILRDVARILAEELGPRVVIVDSSNEIGGDGKVPHLGIGHARRLQVPEPSMQARIMMQAIANHGPEVVIADEIGYHSDVNVVVTMARRGVRFIATAHGDCLKDIVDNPDLTPLLGGIDVMGKRRLARPVFASALEIKGKGQLYFHKDTSVAVDALLAGQEPVGEWLSGGEKFQVTQSLEPSQSLENEPSESQPSLLEHPTETRG
jgi:stage III sporulation protein SpoIIIAA